MAPESRANLHIPMSLLVLACLRVACVRSLTLDLLLPAWLAKARSPCWRPHPLRENVKDVFPGTPVAMLVMLSWVYHAGLCHGFFLWSLSRAESMGRLSPEMAGATQKYRAPLPRLAKEKPTLVELLGNSPCSCLLSLAP